MTVSPCFQTDIASPHKPHLTSVVAPRWAQLAGLSLVAALHLVGLSAIPARESKTPLTAPKAIQVHWLNATTASQTQAIQPPPSPVQPATAKPEKSKPNKAQHPAPKPNQAALITSHASTPSAMAADAMPTTTEAPHAATPAPNTSFPATPNTSQQATPDAVPTSLPRLDADYLDNPAPAYPAESRRLGEQGKVILRVLVNADGSVERVTLRKTSGHEHLDDAAQQAVQHWRFIAAQRGDQAIAAWVVIPISFSLEG